MADDPISRQAERGQNFLKSLHANRPIPSTRPLGIVAPMVDQSCLAFRILTRRYGADVAYTPMINAKMYMTHAEGGKGRREAFDLAIGEEGAEGDRPLVIQFCGNDPDFIADAAKIVAVNADDGTARCDAVDINLGCPQDIARRGGYGAWLMDDWGKVERIITTLSESLPTVPTFAKFRVFQSIEQTIEYAQMLERAGASLVACHGRRREQRGQISGLASLPHIRAVKQTLKIPVLTNGNVLFHADLQRVMDETGCDGVMSAEGVLYNPAIFNVPPPGSILHTWPSSVCDTGIVPDGTTLRDIEESGLHPRNTDLVLEYLDIVQALKTRSTLTAIKGHLFKLLRPALAIETDLRDKLAKINSKDIDGKGLTSKEREQLGWEKNIREYTAVCLEMKQRMEKRRREAISAVVGDNPSESELAGDLPLAPLIRWDDKTGLPVLPVWLAQPYFRGSPNAPPSRTATTAADL